MRILLFLVLLRGYVIILRRGWRAIINPAHELIIFAK